VAELGNELSFPKTQTGLFEIGLSTAFLRPPSHWHPSSCLSSPT